MPKETFHVGVNLVRSKIGLYGNKTKIAVIDSGVYYLHPALGGCFGSGCKIAFGYDYVGDAYGTSNMNAVPDSDPIDNCSQFAHGTHVAGIIAAVANLKTGDFRTPFDFTGVAPEVIIGAYRIYGCAADVSADDIVAAAIYQAASDGADIINLSMGSAAGYSDDLKSVAASKVTDAGHFVICSNGNAADQGLFVAMAPAVGLNNFGIASFENAENPYYSITVGSKSYPSIFGENNRQFNFLETLNLVINSK